VIRTIANRRTHRRFEPPQSGPQRGHGPSRCPVDGQAACRPESWSHQDATPTAAGPLTRLTPRRAGSAAPDGCPALATTAVSRSSGPPE
jgi:hypothetical protein